MKRGKLEGVWEERKNKRKPKSLFQMLSLRAFNCEWLMVHVLEDF